VRIKDRLRSAVLLPIRQRRQAQLSIAGALVPRVFIERRTATEEFIEQVAYLVLSGMSVEPSKVRP
jgi:hypothetical protein